MEKLSVVIITYNEEKNIGRCIDSVKEIADDIVVLDSFSTDATESICKQKEVRFFQHAFDGHIEQKNRAITYALHPFVLSLDADEALCNTLKEEIKKLKVNRNADGYVMNRLTSYCGQWIRHSGWYPDRKLRLWDSRIGKWQGYNPHDKYVMPANAKIQHLKGDILHYSYLSVNQHIKQIHSFTDISSKALFEKGRKGSLGRILFSPTAKFLKCYIIRGGFRDGYYGFLISSLSAYATFLKYVKIRELQKRTG